MSLHCVVIILLANVLAGYLLFCCKRSKSEANSEVNEVKTPRPKSKTSNINTTTKIIIKIVQPATQNQQQSDVHSPSTSDEDQVKMNPKSKFVAPVEGLTERTYEVNTVDPREGAKQPKRLTPGELQQKAKEYAKRVRDKELKTAEQKIEQIEMDVKPIELTEEFNQSQKTQDDISRKKSPHLNKLVELPVIVAEVTCTEGDSPARQKSKEKKSVHAKAHRPKSGKMSAAEVTCTQGTQSSETISPERCRANPMERSRKTKQVEGKVPLVSHNTVVPVSKEDIRAEDLQNGQKETPRRSNTTQKSTPKKNKRNFCTII
ncbi:hypothetical protein Ddc_07194 [Ditylenchus destructor]|nr:hypothetical protein Ddc_07194 [Ditylenchus destructor]